MPQTQTQDKWAEWLLKNRHGNDEEHRRRVIEGMRPWRDKVIENAKLEHGHTLLDVGTGDGLIAFGALEKVGADGRVIFSDISESLLEVCRDGARALDVLDQCEFLALDAIDLTPIASESVDAVTTRSVIIYVQEKQRAFDEFFRVLKPSGRVSLFEPIGKLSQEYIEKGRFLGYDVSPLKDLFDKMHAAHAAQEASQNTMGDFDERDLVKMLWKSGFSFVHLDLDVTIGHSGYYAHNWEAFYNSAPNPLVPTLRQQAEASLTADEQTRVIAHLKPLVETNSGKSAQCLAYVYAIK